MSLCHLGWPHTCCIDQTDFCPPSAGIKGVHTPPCSTRESLIFVRPLARDSSHSLTPQQPQGQPLEHRLLIFKWLSALHPALWLVLTEPTLSDCTLGLLPSSKAGCITQGESLAIGEGVRECFKFGRETKPSKTSIPAVCVSPNWGCVFCVLFMGHPLSSEPPPPKSCLFCPRKHAHDISVLRASRPDCQVELGLNSEISSI